MGECDSHVRHQHLNLSKKKRGSDGRVMNLCHMVYFAVSSGTCGTFHRLPCSAPVPARTQLKYDAKSLCSD